MIKKTALFLLCCYLFSATEFSQFLKLPVLIGHYLEHKQQHKDLSLWGFLCIHYANGDVHDSDYLQDMKLPFKTCSNQGHGEKPLNMRLAESLVPEDMVTEYLPPRLGYYKFMETAALRGSIWQPPKLG